MCRHRRMTDREIQASGYSSASNGSALTIIVRKQTPGHHSSSDRALTALLKLSCGRPRDVMNQTDTSRFPFCLCRRISRCECISLGAATGHTQGAPAAVRHQHRWLPFRHLRVKLSRLWSMHTLDATLELFATRSRRLCLKGDLPGLCAAAVFSFPAFHTTCLSLL